jgi:anthranilate synthase component I
MNIFSKTTAFNADVYTPVELFLSLRNQFRKVCLMESNDYHQRDNSKSFIGLEPIVEIRLKDSCLTIETEAGVQEIKLGKDTNVNQELDQILASFHFDSSTSKFNGFFGRIGFEFALLSERQISKKLSSLDLPDVHLFVFKYLIVIDHFKNDGFVIENCIDLDQLKTGKGLDHLLVKQAYTELPFELIGEETSDFEDAEFESLVNFAKDQIQRGNVFQLVVSNAFKQSFFGDDFQVYRQLRRLNPSPYLFYFDFEDYRLFGSSPEAQLIVSEGKAEIHPIAGTVPKTGNYKVDQEKVAFLIQDEKENAEHTMLVDLARNDLSKSCTNVQVETYKEVQYFSHVIHLVSKVTGCVETTDAMSLLSASFPAGTLSGTPKPKALELIAQSERTTRDYYGGAIGRIGFQGDLNMAIVIRSMLSKNNQLHYRAGAGVVLDSNSINERKEVFHKLNAVRRAIEKAVEKTSVNNSIIQ